jgi:hypothetical protein
VTQFSAILRVSRCYKQVHLWYAGRRMTPAPRPSFEPAGAGAILLSVTGVGIVVGALLGWLAGSVGLGILAGAFVGLPCAVAAVYFRYRGAL